VKDTEIQPVKSNQDASTVRLFGVDVLNITRGDAIGRICEMIDSESDRSHSVFFVNTHTLNTAATDSAYKETLNSADLVFGDGTGVRWAVRFQGRRMVDNVNGTDLIPELYAASADREYRYFLLGCDELGIEKAAARARELFPRWRQVGYHHGYLTTDEIRERAIAQVQDARPDLLLVGMGNPLQERFIETSCERLGATVSIGVGGLFTYWTDELKRSPLWLRKLGAEWLGILAQQPKKAARYLVGNPKFVFRAMIDAFRARRDRAY